MRLPLVYHPDYSIPQLAPGHGMPMSKYGYLVEALKARDLFHGALAPGAASLQMIARVHEISYVERVFNTTLSRAETRLLGLPNVEAVGRRARLSVMGTLLAARLAMQNGIAANMAGGSHHAGPLGGRGYCVFNDVAVSAAELLAAGDVRRVLVIDLDVHQGDGTAEIFERNPGVFTFSMHAGRNYPAAKARSDFDLGLPDGTDDAGYLTVLKSALEQIEKRLLPDLVFYNAGVDPHQNDRLGRLSLTHDGLRARDRAVIDWCKSHGLPLTVVLGGGYSHDLAELAERHAIVFEEAQASLDAGTGMMAKEEAGLG